MHDTRMEKMAKILVQYSLFVKPNEMVVIEAGVVSLPLVRAIFKEVLIAGGNPILDISDDECTDLFYRHAETKQLKYRSGISDEMIKKAHKWVTIWGDDNTNSCGLVDPKKMTITTKASEITNNIWRIRTSSKISKNKALRWVGTQMPCQSAAHDANMSLLDYEDFLYKAAAIGLRNPVEYWEQMEENQLELIKRLDKIRHFRIIAENGTDLELCVPANRGWRPCAGKENFPDGEVYCAPDEDTVHGTFVASFKSVYHGVEVTDACFRFTKGQLALATSHGGKQFLQGMVLSDKGASKIGEFAFGLNYNIRRSTGNILFDEKIGGTFHIALGDSYEDSGGTNKSTIHWDFVCDLRKGGRVFGDGIPIYDNGAFL